MDISWNPWHGCHKYSEGCQHCYVYRGDARFGRDSSIVTKSKDFLKILAKDRSGKYKIPSNSMVYTCFTSDFFVEDADEWRTEAWQVMKTRSDLSFFLITKRISRLKDCLPSDWGDGYDNVEICCTVENQKWVDERLPIYLSSPIKTKTIICEPLLEKIDLSCYLNDSIRLVVVGGESGLEARPLDYDWVLSIRTQCIEHNVAFFFKQTGAKFIKNGKIYNIERKFQGNQARKAQIDYRYNRKGVVYDLFSESE